MNITELSALSITTLRVHVVFIYWESCWCLTPVASTTMVCVCWDVVNPWQMLNPWSGDMVVLLLESWDIHRQPRVEAKSVENGEVDI